MNKVCFLLANREGKWLDWVDVSWFGGKPNSINCLLIAWYMLGILFLAFSLLTWQFLFTTKVTEVEVDG